MNIKDVLVEAKHKYGIKDFMAGFSGGKDSVTALDVVFKLGKLYGVVYCDTGIGIQETKDFVMNFCEKRKLELVITKPKMGERYEDFVLKNGFPHQGMHNAIMGYLKGHPLRTWCSKHEGIGILSGVRKFESNRRGRTAKVFSKDGALTWIAPIIDWRTEQVWDYVKKNNLPTSPIYKTLHLSGDCLCGAFSDFREAELICQFYPELKEKIISLEKKVFCNKQCKKIHVCKWGNQSSMQGASQQSQLSYSCADCQISNSEVTNGLPPTSKEVGIRPTIL